MAKFQLIVKGESGKYTRGDCAVIDLDGDTIEEARASARLQLVGDRTLWQAGWRKNYDNEMELVVWLNPDDALDLYHGVLLNPDRETEVVHQAWIVQVAEHVGLDTLRNEVRDWTVEQRQTLQADPEYQEYMRLKRKFG
jgi:hypothetical protein